MVTETLLSDLKDPNSPPLHIREKGPISLLDLLIVLAARKRLILGITLLFAVASCVISLILPARYTANTTVLPPQQSSSISSALTAQLNGVAALAGGGGLASVLKNPNDLYVGMLRSRTVEDAMIQRFGLEKEYHLRNLVDTRKAFENHTEVDGEANDKMIHISVVDHDPQRAADIANSYIQEFQHLSEQLAITEASQRRLFFERELQRAKDNLANAEEELKTTQQKTGLIQVNSQAQALIQSVAALRAQVAAKQVEIQGIKTYAAGQNAQLIQAQQELEGLQAQLAMLGGSSDTSSAGLIVPRGKVPEAGLEYIRKERDVKYYETIFDILARQFELAKLDEAKEGAVIQIVDAAVPPDKRSFPRRTVIVIGATFIGLLLGVSWSLAAAGMTYLKSSPEANAKLLHLRQMLIRSTPQSG